jgi:hypothetical protein
VCARKQLFEPGNFFARKSLVSCTLTVVICGHINGSSHITEQLHLWQRDDYLAVDESLWRILHWAMEKRRRVGDIYDIFITKDMRFGFLARKLNPISSEFWGVSAGQELDMRARTWRHFITVAFCASSCFIL